MLTAGAAGKAPTEEPPPPNEAFPPERTAALFQSWQGAGKALIAVSGGPDSLALALLAAEWAAGRPDAPALCLATVDHGLRARSAAEAAEVAQFSAELGLPHATLVWRGEKPVTKIQERAREARYALLFDHARAIGAGIVATAHHADDQAETILFRFLRGSGPAGLAGMAPSRARFGLIHSRPLLGVAKSDLVAHCRARGRSFICDPSNENPAFARARMRTLLPLLADEGLGRDALLRLGRRAARAEAALRFAADAATARLSPRLEDDAAVFDLTPVACEPDEIFLRVLARLLDVGPDAGSPDAPTLRLHRLENLGRRLQNALRSHAVCHATLGGAVLKLRADGRLSIAREKPRRGKGRICLS